ncbi:conserved hypothetical protein [Frankia canadensis]|uniref:Secreted protein n=1 Tax=Frankia canadensis TaxID=1836972 RepID=A0A2I2KJA2_9ACTN|nr:conserved hypothetical protein [Frankia canadensis]SOU53024.1 conserved hypothetical protein [Frankia canadensis]
MGAVLALAAGVLLAACGGPGPVRLTDVAVPAPSQRASCAALIQALPASLGDGLDRRRLDPPQTSAAAFGRGPVVVSCGAAGVPASYRPDSRLSVIDDVGWFSEKVGDGMRFSTPTRSPHIVLTMPAAALEDAQPFDVLVGVAAAVRAHSRSTTA